MQQQQTPRRLLTQAVTSMNQQLQGDLAVGYELIPETGGVPRSQPIYAGEWLLPDTSQLHLTSDPHLGSLSELIGRWQPVYQPQAQIWSQTYAANESDYARFLQLEAVESFIFLPVAHHDVKLAALLFHFRRPYTITEEARHVLEACSALLGMYLARQNQTAGPTPIPKKQKAIAHTLYGKVAVIFKGELDALEVELGRMMANGLPPEVTERLTVARNVVFEGMRHLVIEASGDLLVDLQTMSLWKALSTAVAALKRAWPPPQRVNIDLHPIPIIIERQSLALRQLLYTLILEAVGNAIKHGGPAPYINIDLNWADNQVFVQIIDHGQGFDLEAHPFSQYGLGFWQTHIVQHLGGTFNVSSQPGFGAVVSATIPVIPARMDSYVE
ncbi:MAG: ATP-binding protein [Anaerolineae bacterium]